MALIKSPTVSVPVVLYVVVWVPSLTLIPLFGGMPRAMSGVVASNGTVPVPVASLGVAGAGVFEDELVLPVVCAIALLSAAVS